MSRRGVSLNKALAAWGRHAPDWIKTLAEACDETSLRKVAERLKVSPAILSLAINARREKLDFVKTRVEAVLMISIVACPVLGVMGKNECLQEQAKPYNAANPLRIRLFRTCRNGCPNYTSTNKEKSDAQSGSA